MRTADISLCMGYGMGMDGYGGLFGLFGGQFALGRAR